MKAYKEKAAKDAEKRVKEFDKLQKKAGKYIEEEEKRRLKKQKEMEKHGTVKNGLPGENERRPSVAPLYSLRHKDSRLLYGQSPKFSEIVANSQNDNHTGSKPKMPVLGHTGVYKKLQKKGQTMSGTKVKSQGVEGDFKVFLKLNVYVVASKHAFFTT